MKNKGYTLIELLVVIVIMGIGTLLTVISVSHAFSSNKKEAYEADITYLLNMAESYGNDVKTEIADATHGITVTVESLIEKGYVNAGSDGKFLDPRNTNNDLNDLRIRITLIDDEIKTEVIE